MGSDLERDFSFYVSSFHLPTPVREYRFAAEHVGIGSGIRNRLREARLHDWRFDFCWIEQKVAVEVDGGVYAKGRHVRGKGYELDCAKRNAATVMGFRVLNFTGGMLRRDPAKCMGQVKRLLGGG